MLLLSHVLEHVADPLQLILDAKAGLNPGGMILFSLPYSPLSRKDAALGVWDIMNLPPHHLTRWRRSAFEALARRADMRLELLSAAPKPVLGRALKLSKLSGKGSWLARMAGAWSRLRQRDRIGPRRAGDVVLGVLRLP